ncbi:molecular chaperone [Spirochaetia bacterium]|nr:molecular chaperone [Spirochaetia bacterium]
MNDKSAGATYLKRYEQKYLLNEEQYRAVQTLLGGRFRPDSYGESVVYSVYYDTGDYRIIRSGFTKSAYREKLRLRCYGAPGADDTVYVELKKKYQGITYKRRFPVPFSCLNDDGAPPLPPEKQPLYGEFAWFYKRYDLSPAFFIVYDRTALEGVDDPNVRITFDTNIRFRRGGFAEGLLECSRWTPILQGPHYLMELKTVNAVPFDLCRSFSEAGIYPVSFSKVKTAWQATIKPKLINLCGESRHENRRVNMNTFKEAM